MDNWSSLDEASPEIQERVRGRFARQGLLSHIGAYLVHIGKGRVHIALPHRPEVSQQDGYVHAGATSAIADTAGGLAALTYFPDSTAVLAVEYKINFIAPAAGDHLVAEGLVLKSGRTLTVCRLEVYAIQAERRTLVAVGQQTLICLPDHRATPAQA